MIITKKESERFDDVGKRIVLTKEDKTLFISYEGNLDLYFKFNSVEDNTFEITKDNNYIYDCFLNLYNDIKDNNLYELDEITMNFLQTPEEIEEEKKIIKELNESAKSTGHYDELFNNDIITWRSDDRDWSEAGSVSIKKEGDKFLLTFSDTMTSIRFRNSGSYYDPYNIIFMKFFNNLMEYDENDRQIHMEEYLYEENKKVGKR